MRKVIFDTETNTLNPQKGSIIEIAMLELNEHNQLTGNFFHSYVNPQQPISHIASQITGINFYKIKDAPTIHQLKPDILQFVQDKELISHYLDFNLRMLEHNLQGKLNNPTFDTLKLCRQQFPNTNVSLSTLRKKLKLKKCNLFNSPLVLDCYYIYQIYNLFNLDAFDTNPEV